MGKKIKKAIKKAAPKITVKKPKITVGKDLGTKNIGKVASNVAKAASKAGTDISRGIGKGATAAYKTAGNYGSAVTRTLGKGAEGIVGNSFDVAKALAKGDFKGIGKEGLELLQSGKNTVKGLAKAKAGLYTGGLGAVGSALSDKNIKRAATNIERETNKGVDKYGDAAIDMAANLGTAGIYGAAQSAAAGLASGGLKGLLSGEGLKQAALSAAGSYAGIDPNILKMGMSAAQGDLKGAALQGLGSFAGLSPEQMKMANVGASALTGDKAGLASGLASQFGAGADLSRLVGAAAGGKDIKGAALQQLGSMAGFDPKQIQTGIAALTGDKAGLASSLASQFGAGNTASSMIGQFAGGKGAREVISDQAGAYADNEANRLLDEQMGRAGLDRAGVKQIQDRIKGAAKEAGQGYKIAAGDTFNAIAKKMGVSPEQLKAANPQIKDINKIAAGATLNLPGVSNAIRDLSGPLREGVVESGQMTEEQFDEARDQGPGFFDRARDFIGENKNLLGGAVQVAGAIGGYAAADSARKEQKELAERQLQDVQDIGGKFKGMQYDPERYKQEREFLQQRVAGGGVTAQERKMQQEGDVRAARAAAAQRLAGMEQQARLGGSAMGTSALAAALSGAQSGQNIQAETNLSREASASQRLEQDIQRQGQLSTKQTAEEAELAKQQSEFGLNQVKQVGAEREELSKLAQARGEAAGKLAGSLADTAVGVMDRVESPEYDEGDEDAELWRSKEAEWKQQAEQQKKAEAGLRLQMEERKKQADLEAKRKAAQTMSMGGTAQQPAPAKPATGKPGEGYGVLQSSMNTAGGAIQKATDMFNQFNQKPPAQLQQAQNVIQKGQQVMQQVQQTADKAKNTYEQFKKSPFGKFF